MPGCGETPVFVGTPLSANNVNETGMGSRPRPLRQLNTLRVGIAHGMRSYTFIFLLKFNHHMGSSTVLY